MTEQYDKLALVALRDDEPLLLPSGRSRVAEADAIGWALVTQGRDIQALTPEALARQQRDLTAWQQVYPRRTSGGATYAVMSAWMRASDVVQLGSWLQLVAPDGDQSSIQITAMEGLILDQAGGLIARYKVVITGDARGTLESWGIESPDLEGISG